MTPTRWTRETVIEAAQQWARDHDGQAPRMNDWSRAAPAHPSAYSMKRSSFGSWNAMIEAAGLTTKPQGGPLTAEDSHRTRWQRLSKQHRSEGSVTATFGLGDERVVEVFYPEQVAGRRGEMSGSLKEATRMAADYCRALGPDWRIYSLSTPMSILSDLHGRAHRAARTGRFNGDAKPDAHPSPPELQMLRGDDANLFVQRPA